MPKCWSTKQVPQKVPKYLSTPAQSGKKYQSTIFPSKVAKGSNWSKYQANWQKVPKYYNTEVKCLADTCSSLNRARSCPQLAEPAPPSNASTFVTLSKLPRKLSPFFHPRIVRNIAETQQRPLSLKSMQCVHWREGRPYVYFHKFYAL